MPERLISEAIKPLTETADTLRMAIGEPGLPHKFMWRGRTVTVAAALRTWRETKSHVFSSQYILGIKHSFRFCKTSKADRSHFKDSVALEDGF